MSLLLENGYDPKKCRHACFASKGETSLLAKINRRAVSILEEKIEEYVEQQELRNWKC